MVTFFRYFVMGGLLMGLTACDQAKFPLLSGSTSSLTGLPGVKVNSEDSFSVSDLDMLIKNSRPKVNFDAGFAKAVLQALDQDPTVLASKNEAEASKEKLRNTEADRDTQIKATVLGGVEDLTDKTAGVAAILTANRMLYDGGMLDAKIDAARFQAQAVEQSYFTIRNEQAFKLANSWIELEHYQDLMDLLGSRLSILEPLLEQLESVAKAGVGDASQVAAAQRTVSSILVAEADISEKYQNARIVFINGFGRLPSKAKYDSIWMSKNLPTQTTKKIAENSPGLLATYWAYRASEATVVAVKAQDKFSIGAQIKLQKPFGGSGVSSDESVGLALTKLFYSGNKHEAQVKQAQAQARALGLKVTATHRDGELLISSARQLIKSMDKAIELARINAASSREEIEYLRKQLIIGGSTLESVLSAEVRLYQAESQEVGFIADRQKAEAKILAVSGNFSSSLGSN